jgi:LmbE family N-acetylglucosaminyl deacetylase
MLNVLAFFAHPDDETILMGGTLALLAEKGADLHFLCATRGEGGEVGEPPLTTPDQLGEVREQELLCAVQALGSPKSLTFLGYTDPRVGPQEELYPFTNNLAILAGQVSTSIKQLQIDVVLTHGSNGEYGHPAHILCHQAALTAVLAIAEEGGLTPPLLYTVQAYFPEHPKPRLANQDDPAHLIVDVSAVLDKKEKAALCHQTQNALFVRRASEDAGRTVTVREALMTRESFHRGFPEQPSMESPKDEFANLIK